MPDSSTRAGGRPASQLRPLRFQNGIAPYATGSTLIEWGHTRVICDSIEKLFVVASQPVNPSFEQWPARHRAHNHGGGGVAEIPARMGRE